MEKNTKETKYSYSRLNTFDNCGWKYKLIYVDKHYVNTDNIANLLGTVLHSVEENIALKLKNHEPINYDYWKDYFLNVNIPKKNAYDTEGGIFGVNILRERFQSEFFEVDEKTGDSYYTKCLEYLNTGIYRLENYMKEHPELEIYDVEHFFQVKFHSLTLYGFIDRIFYNKDTHEYILEDIKTKGHLFSDKELTTPLQFAIYSIALKEQLNLPEYPTICHYDLPFCGARQDAGTKGFINRAIKKIDKIAEGINSNDYVPKPSALCYWCCFSKTFPNQPEEAKNLCPYYSLWTKNGSAKVWETASKWQGIEHHEEVMKRFKEQEVILYGDPNGTDITDKFNFDF